MEAVGIAASIIAIVQLTCTCLKLGNKFLGPSKHSPQALKDISATLYSFNATIKNLQTNFEINEEDRARLSALDLLDTPLETCIEALGIIHERLQSIDFIEKVILTAVERYVRNVAEDVREIQTTLNENGKRLSEFDDRVRKQYEHTEAWHDAQKKTIDQVRDGVQEHHLKVNLWRSEAELQEKQTRRLKLLDWLSFVNHRSNQIDALHLKEPGTGQWLICHELFRRWEAEVSKPLWLHGIPGAGKTILSAGIIEHLERNRTLSAPQEVVAYFYFDFKDEIKQKTRAMLNSIARQISSALYPSSPSGDVSQLYEKCNNGSCNRVPCLDELVDLVVTLASSCGKAFIVLDALDECAERATLIKVILRLQGKSECIKLLLTSRSEPDIKAAFTGASFDSISIQIDHVTQDIRLFVRSILQKDPELCKLSSSLKDHVESSLVAGANSMFRWVKCQIDSIRLLKRDKTIREALKNLPKTLDETYERVLLASINDEPEDNVFLLRRILQFVTFAKRPLQLHELAEAIVIEVESDALDPEARFHDPQQLLSICAPLVVPSQHTGLLGFVHYSVKEYLLSTRISERKCRARMFALTDIAGHSELAKICLAYLNFQDFSIGACETKLEKETRLKEYPFLDYSANHWYQHTQEPGVEKEVLTPLAKLLVPQKNPRLANAIQMGISTHGDLDLQPGEDVLSLEDNWPERFNMNSLATASFLGFTRVLRPIVESGADINALGGYNGNTLQAAAYQGNLNAVTILLDLGADIDYPNSTLEPNRLDDFGSFGTALTMAITSNHEKVVDLLLARDANPNAVDKGLVAIALTRAVAMSNMQVLETLLDRGVQINLALEEFLVGAPLFMAVQFRNREVVDLLLRYGGVNGMRGGRSPLPFCRSQWEWEDILELLVNAGYPLDWINRLRENINGSLES